MNIEQFPPADSSERFTLRLIYFFNPSLKGQSMGRGDKRTRKGKIFRSSYGKTRPHDPNKKEAAAPAGTRRPQRPQPR
jgi:ribosomal small subunit protein bTHX